MFVGHFGVALAAKRVAPRTSLGTLMLAAGFLDILWPAFLVLGWEHVRIDPGNTAVTPLDFYDYPLSHSLLMVIGWAIAFAIVYFAAKRYARGAAIAGALVLSHWVLDFVTHRPDLPLWPDGPKVGLGLWGSLAGTIVGLLSLLLFAWPYWVDRHRAPRA